PTPHDDAVAFEIALNPNGCAIVRLRLHGGLPDPPGGLCIDQMADVVDHEQRDVVVSRDRTSSIRRWGCSFGRNPAQCPHDIGKVHRKGDGVGNGRRTSRDTGEPTEHTPAPRVPVIELAGSYR